MGHEVRPTISTLHRPQNERHSGGGWRRVAAGGGGWRRVAAGGGGWRRVAAGGGGWRRVAAGGGGWRRVAAGGGGWRRVAAGGGMQLDDEPQPSSGRAAQSSPGLRRLGEIALRQVLVKVTHRVATPIITPPRSLWESRIFTPRPPSGSILVVVSQHRHRRPIVIKWYALRLPR